MDFRTIRLAPNADQGPLSPALEEGVELSAEEVRVLGALVEKDATTPDYYPLTLNALVSACNQKSSRHPVVNYSDDEVLAAIDALKAKGLVHRITSSDGRTPRYRHVIHDALRLNTPQGAILCVLLLRGAQTVGEIRQRTNRIYPFDSLQEVEDTLEELSNKEPRPLAVKLPRQSGEKEARYHHLLSGEPPPQEEMATGPDHPSDPSRLDRTQALEEQIAELRDELATLRAEFDRFREQF